MITDFHRMEFTSQMLREWWPRKILQLQEIRTHLGVIADDLIHLIALCEYVIHSGMDSRLFPGAAPGILRIAK